MFAHPRRPLPGSTQIWTIACGRSHSWQSSRQLVTTAARTVGRTASESAALCSCMLKVGLYVKCCVGDHLCCSGADEQCNQSRVELTSGQTEGTGRYNATG